MASFRNGDHEAAGQLVELFYPELRRIAAALGELGPGAHETARRFLAAMIDPEDRAGVLEFIERANQASRRT